MSNPAKCAARDPMTCRYHGTIQKMSNALRDGDSDAYLTYKARVEILERQPNPESFFDPTSEAEEIVSSQQLSNLINSHPNGDDQLDQTYKAELDLGATYGRIYGKRYRRFAKQKAMKFTETRDRGAVKFLFTATNGRDLRHIRMILEDTEHHLASDKLQGEATERIAAARR